MPELPEVETIRRDLAKRLPGARVEALWTSGFPLRMNRPLDVAGIRKVTVGGQFQALDRMGKHLLLRTDRGTVVVHLGMSGHLLVVPGGEVRAPHTHLIWTLGDGRELRYVDPRRFGMVSVGDPAGSGIEPLGPGFDDARLAAMLEGSRRAIKALLLDQSKIAGLGNIYVCEALFLAQIHPSAQSLRVTGPRVTALRQAIVDVLKAGIRNRGTTLRDYTDASGRKGKNQYTLHVYGRQGEPCTRCGAVVKRQVDQGRSTFLCVRCQRR